MKVADVLAFTVIGRVEDVIEEMHPEIIVEKEEGEELSVLCGEAYYNMESELSDLFIEKFEELGKALGLPLETITLIVAAMNAEKECPEEVPLELEHNDGFKEYLTTL